MTEISAVTTVGLSVKQAELTEVNVKQQLAAVDRVVKKE